MSNASVATVSATQSQPLAALEIAHVLSAEIADSSTLPMDQRTRLMGRLVRIISSTQEFRGAREGDHFIGLPTDDGMTLVFFQDPVAPVRCASEIARAVQSYPEMKLRMGIHSGPVYRVAGIDARANVSGEAIKTAQRIMSTGDAEHILVSKQVAETLSQLGHWSKCLTDLGERELAPGTRLQLFNLCTGEVGNPDQPRAITGTLAPTAAAPAAAASAAAPVVANRVKPVFILAAVAVIVALIGAYFLLKPKPERVRPVLTAEFSETFSSLDRWNVPPNGWSFVNQALRIDSQPMVGYPPEVNLDDFTMTFQLELISDSGAAWALRMKDQNNYYLFYLCGPTGTTPNSLLTYVVQDGKTTQQTAFLVLGHLVAGGQYTIKIEAKNNQITHWIKPDKTQPEFEDAELGYEKTLGLFTDLNNTFPTGGIGFRTVGSSDKFAIRALTVSPRRRIARIVRFGL